MKNEPMKDLHEEGLYAQAEIITSAFQAEQNKPVSVEAHTWVVEVFDSYVVIEADHEMFRVNFTRSDDEIEFEDRSLWVEVEKKQEWIEKSFGVSMARGDALIFQGGAIKALGNGKVGGNLILFGDENTLDLEGEYFNAETDYDLERSKAASIYFNHGLDPILKNRRLGRGTMEPDDVGIWIEAQLELRDEYERAVYQLVEDGKMGWSSATAPNLMEREVSDNGKAVWIKSWPLGLDASLTVIPAEPRIKAIPLKSYVKSIKYDLKELLEGAGKASVVDLTSWGTEEWAQVYEIYTEVQHEQGGS